MIDRRFAGHTIPWVSLGIATLCYASAATAQWPTVVDDASTMDRGGTRIEAGWTTDDDARGVDATLTYGLLDGLEVGIGVATARDSSTDPRTRADEVAIGLKWVPLQADIGLSLGVAAELGQVRVDMGSGAKETVRGHAITGLVSWNLESGQSVHLNLGYAWERLDGDTAGVATWGVGFWQPVTDALSLTLEVYGDEDNKPDTLLGGHWDVSDGLTLSAGIGRGDSRTFGGIGVTWEF